MNRAIFFALVCVCLQSSCSDRKDPSVDSANRQPSKGSATFKVEATNSAVAQSTQQLSSATVSRRVQPTLPSESLVIQSGGVSVDKVGKLVQSDKFDAFVSRLSAESDKSQLARDLTALERKNIEDFFGDKAYLQNFACGTSVCVGTVAMGRDSTIYKKFSDDFLANGPANASLIDYPVKLDNGDFEQRLVMSVGSSLNGVKFKAHP